MTSYYVLELLETSTPIKWWNENRAQINELIQAFNDWQKVHNFDPKEGTWLLARIRNRIKTNNEYASWQVDLLRGMETFIMNAMPDLEVTPP